MGIKHQFKRTIEEMWSGAFKNVDYTDIGSKTIALDMFGIICKYKATSDNWLNLFDYFVIRCQRHGIKLVAVFEGVAPIEKSGERQVRRARRDQAIQLVAGIREALDKYCNDNVLTPLIEGLVSKSIRPGGRNSVVYAKVIEDRIVEQDESVYSPVPDPTEIIELLGEKIRRLELQNRPVTVQDLDSIRELCVVRGIEMVDAVGEAEQTCAQLCKQGKVDAVMSEDSDLIALHCPAVLTQCRSKVSKFTLFNFEKLVELSGLTPEQILDWAILCGTDYNTPIKGLGVKYAYENIVTFGSIEKMLENEKIITRFNIDQQKITALNHVRVRELFTV